MPLLPKTTPQRTVPIKSFVVYLVDGRTIQVSTDGGQGFFREEHFAGDSKSFSTHQCFVANGRARILPTFGKEVKLTNVSETDVPDDDDDEETEDDE